MGNSIGGRRETVLTVALAELGPVAFPIVPPFPLPSRILVVRVEFLKSEWPVLAITYLPAVERSGKHSST